MATVTTDILNLGKLMERVSILGQMVKFTMVNGSKV